MSNVETQPHKALQRFIKDLRINEINLMAPSRFRKIEHIYQARYLKKLEPILQVLLKRTGIPGLVLNVTDTTKDSDDILLIDTISNSAKQEIPPFYEKFFQNVESRYSHMDKDKVAKIASSLKSQLKEASIPKWEPVSASELGENLSSLLRTTLFLDVLFELMLSYENEKPFGEVPVDQIIELIKSDTENYQFLFNDELITDLVTTPMTDSEKQEQLITFLHASLKTYISPALNTDNPNVDEILQDSKAAKNWEDVKRQLEILLPADLSPYYKVIFQCYCKELKDYLSPSEDLLNMMRDETRTYKQKEICEKRKKRTIRREHRKLYSQLPYNYLARWITNQNCTQKQIESKDPRVPMISSKIINMGTSLRMSTLSKADNKLSSLIPIRDDTSENNGSLADHEQQNKLDELINAFENLPKLKSGNKNRKYIGLAMHMVNISRAVTDFQNLYDRLFGNLLDINNMSTSQQDTWSRDCLLSLFNLEYLLRHSTLMQAEYYHLISQVATAQSWDMTAQEAYETYPPSFYTYQLLEALLSYKLPLTSAETKQLLDKYNSCIKRALENRQKVYPSLNLTPLQNTDNEDSGLSEEQREQIELIQASKADLATKLESLSEEEKIEYRKSEAPDDDDDDDDLQSTPLKKEFALLVGLFKQGFSYSPGTPPIFDIGAFCDTPSTTDSNPTLFLFNLAKNLQTQVSTNNKTEWEELLRIIDRYKKNC